MGLLKFPMRPVASGPSSLALLILIQVVMALTHWSRSRTSCFNEAQRLASIETRSYSSPDNRQLDNLKEAMRSSLAWDGIVRDAETGRLDLKTSDIALAKDKAKESRETVQTRLKETWCYLIYPYQDTAQSDVELTSARIPAQDGVLGRASKKLVSDEALLPEIGPERLNRELEKYIWNGKPHLHLKDLWEYINRYTYLPRMKNRDTLIKSVQSAVSGMLPGPFAYAERWDEGSQVLRWSGDREILELTCVD